VSATRHVPASDSSATAVWLFVNDNPPCSIEHQFEINLLVDSPRSIEASRLAPFKAESIFLLQRHANSLSSNFIWNHIVVFEQIIKIRRNQFRGFTHAERDDCRCLNLSTSMGGTRSKVEGGNRHDLEPEGTREDTRHKIYTSSGSRSSYPTSYLE
jgi:hypothetical protein